MSRAVITGGSGRLGKWVVREFLSAGYDVVNADLKPPKDGSCRYVCADLTDLGEAYGILKGADALVHLAAVPSPGGQPDEVVYRNNVLSGFNVLEASAGLGISKVVIASSESIYGYVFPTNVVAPQYVPVDEEHPLCPEDCYALSKLVNERAAEAFHRRTGMQIVSLRLGNVVEPDYYHSGFVTADTNREAFVLWSYIDARDAATACRLAVERDQLAALVVNIAADENRLDVPSRELLAKHYPGVSDVRAPLEGYETLLANSLAKKCLGWSPAYHWRDLA